MGITPADKWSVGSSPGQRHLLPQLAWHWCAAHSLPARYDYCSCPSASSSLWFSRSISLARIAAAVAAGITVAAGRSRSPVAVAAAYPQSSPSLSVGTATRSPQLWQMQGNACDAAVVAAQSSSLGLRCLYDACRRLLRRASCDTSTLCSRCTFAFQHCAHG